MFNYVIYFQPGRNFSTKSLLDGDVTMRSSASPPSTKRHSESRHSTDDDDVDDDVEDEEDVDVEQCSDGEDLKDSSEPPSKKVIIINNICK